MIKWGTLASLLFVALLADPAYAVPNRLSLSMDGRHWATSIEQALFDSSDRWVPGDAQTVTFWVRNESGQPADLRIDVIDIAGTLRPGRDLRLMTAINGENVPIVGGRTVSHGERGSGTDRVAVTVMMPADVGNTSQRRAIRFRLRVTLKERPTGVPLPPTGAPRLADPMMLLGVLTLAAGVALLRRGRVRRDST